MSKTRRYLVIHIPLLIIFALATGNIPGTMIGVGIHLLWCMFCTYVAEGQTSVT